MGLYFINVVLRRHGAEIIYIEQLRDTVTFKAYYFRELVIIIGVFIFDNWSSSR
ncbi:MAG: hypothetical protein LBN42_03060 [Oscillospiraceae bacterium]|nr:hypothetical protein [Oscillospiraceae bacterium]